MITNGLVHATFLHYLIYLAVMTHITIAAVTIYLHRHQAHRALDMHPLLSHFFRFWLWLTTGMVTKEWVAIHRKHHAFCDTKEDPHSPVILTIKKVLWQGTELYKQEAENQKTMEQFGKGTPDDWLEKNIYSHNNTWGVSILLVINFLLFGFIGVSIWAMQMMWIPFWAAGVINGVGHWRGYRNYETADASTNISPIGILIGGEEFHNNHHTYPNSAKLSSKWWELDIGWFYIRLFELLKLAQVNKVSPKPIVSVSKTSVDTDTLKAIFHNRFQIMARYCKDVIVPVLKDERNKIDDVKRSIFKKIKVALVREESLLDEASKHTLKCALENSQSLATVYKYKQQLQEIWKRSTSTQESLLKLLQDWCKRAEATGIKVLQEFSYNLKAYSMHAV